MQKFKAVFYDTDAGVDKFMVLKDGECALKDFREVSFYPSQKNFRPIQYGDVVEFTVGLLEGSQHIIPKFAAKLDSSPAQRKQNLFSATKIYILNAFTTDKEINCPNNPKVSGCVFNEYIYFEYINSLFGSIAKYYRQNKNQAMAKFAQKMQNQFLENRINTLGRAPEDDCAITDFPKYVKRIKQKHFSMFTSTQKVIDGIHNLIKTDALNKLNQIIELDKQNEKIL